MLDLLEKIQMEKILVSLYTDSENLDKFHVARILHIEDGKLLECNVGPHGEFDGYSAEYSDDIYRIEINTEYMKNITLLMEKYFSAAELCVTDGDPFLFLLNVAKTCQYISTITLKSYENQIIGYVSQIKDNVISVTMISPKGDYDGETMFYFDDIIRIMVNDFEAQQLNYLHKCRDN